MLRQPYGPDSQPGQDGQAGGDLPACLHMPTCVWPRSGVAPDRKVCRFKEAGYRVGYIGKWHLAATGEKPVPPKLRGGYDFWEAADVLEFTSHPYDTVLYDERAIDFIRDGGEPFFLFLSYLEPHQQNDWNRFVAPEGYAERYANPYVPPDLKAFPGDWFQHLPDYYGMVARIDECLGKLLTTLEELGISERTIVVFTSDHGCHFRTRNTEYKRSCHESSIRVPLVILGPGFEGPRLVGELVSLVDVAPTLLEAAGIPVPPEVQGRSLIPLVRGEADGWRSEVFVQISEYLVGRAARTPRWKYCVFAPEGEGGRDPSSRRYVERHLYDLASDPYELVNLVGRREYRKVAKELRERLKRLMVEAGEEEPEIVEAKYYP